MRQRGNPGLAEHSFLRRVDPRAKLSLALSFSAAAMLGPGSLLFALVGCFAFLLLAGLSRPLAAQLRRVALWLAILFVADWALVGVPHALAVSARLLLLVTGFVVVAATTTAGELRHSLELMGLPRRFAFAFATAFHSLEWLEGEWRAVLEAPAARGLEPAPRIEGRPWEWPRQMIHLVPLVVPAVVLGTQRAWALAESAALRGIDTPGLVRPRSPGLRSRDLGLLLLGPALLVLLGVTG